MISAQEARARAEVAEPRDSRVKGEVSKAGYSVSYYMDDGGYYHVSW